MGDFVAFLERLKPTFDKILYSAIIDDTKRDLGFALARAFAESKATGELLLPFDGMQVISAVAHFNENRVEIRWNTDFFPGPRFNRHPSDCMALGFFGEFDLYVASQNTLPPTLIARYGHDPEDYLTFNPALNGLDNASQYGEQFTEALHRALFINYDLGLNR